MAMTRRGIVLLWRAGMVGGAGGGWGVRRGAMLRQTSVTRGDAASQYGETALVEAVSCGYKDTVELLLDRGADLEAKNNVIMQRPLSLPCSWCPGDLNIICTGPVFANLSSFPKEIAVRDACRGDKFHCGCSD